MSGLQHSPAVIGCLAGEGGKIHINLGSNCSLQFYLHHRGLEAVRLRTHRRQNLKTRKETGPSTTLPHPIPTLPVYKYM